MKKRWINIGVVVVLLLYWVTPLTYHLKLQANQILAPKPMISSADTKLKLKFERWNLKDKNGIAFEFDQSFQKPIFIFFFASWDMRSQAALHMIDEFYQKFHSRIDFYIVSNEERAPVVAYFEENNFGFSPIYYNLNESAPLAYQLNYSYLIDLNRNIRSKEEQIQKWNSGQWFKMIEEFLKENE
ncbi:MAG: hypothetical protein CMC18_02015 [Flavobacteriaceae bacterium]|nr:hypothetical protein [Flavobacteriaceae bacterium]